MSSNPDEKYGIMYEVEFPGAEGVGTDYFHIAEERLEAC